MIVTVNSYKRLRDLIITTVVFGFLIPLQLPVYAAEYDRTSIVQQIDQTTGRADRPVRPVKNIILLIPDGCSITTVSAARWYNWLQHPDQPALYIDPFMSGTVRTFSSNAPIGDSAPTTSCYVSGNLSKTGFVSTFPPSDGLNDILKVDASKAYQPMMTILEAARLVYNKSLGLVFTCEFPHATPADCSAHSFYRGDFTSIASQMVHNGLDVVLGGGNNYLNNEQEAYLKSTGVSVERNDLKAMRAFNGSKIWSLFGGTSMPYELDRDTAAIPSLEEMTQKAIGTLSKNPNGFFLMVEGSKIDWAAHANDPVGMMTEFIAFDKACKVALDYAIKDGNTAVLILPDHGNSGFSIGINRASGYDKLTKDQLFGRVMTYKKTATGLSDLIMKAPNDQVGAIIKRETGLHLSQEQLKSLDFASDYSKSPVPAIKRKADKLSYLLAGIMTDSTCFGFTTHGHTGEEVFMASYHPKGDELTGVRLNIEVNDYLCKLFSLENKLPALSDDYFIKHTDLLKGMDYSISTTEPDKFPVLTINYNGKKLVVKDDSNVVLLNGKAIQLRTVVVYVTANKTFYLPKDLLRLLN